MLNMTLSTLFVSKERKKLRENLLGCSEKRLYKRIHELEKICKTYCEEKEYKDCSFYYLISKEGKECVRIISRKNLSYKEKEIFVS